MGCGKAFPLFKVTKWPWFVAWGVGGFFFLCWGGGESCSIQVDCKGDHDQSSSTEYRSGNNRKLTIYLLPVEGGGGRAGVVAVTRILQRFMGRSGKFGNIVTQPNPPPPPPPPRKHGDKWLVQRREPFIREKLLLSFREYLSTFSTDLFETQKMNFNFYLPGYEQWFKVCVPDRNYGVVFIFIFLGALGPYQHVFLIQFYFCFTQWKIDKICRFIKQSTFCR